MKQRPKNTIFLITKTLIVKKSRQPPVRIRQFLIRKGYYLAAYPLLRTAGLQYSVIYLSTVSCCATTSLKYSYVILRPSSRETFGSQPNSFLASVISG